MPKFDSKCILLLALLIFAYGWETRVEARDVSHPCKSVQDCGDPRYCQCLGGLNICACHYPPSGLARQTAKSSQMKPSVP